MYLWLKAAHVIAVIIWMAGMLATPPILHALGNITIDQRARLRATFHRIVTPAMITTLILGIWLGVSGGWFADAWLIAKLAVVLVLTGVHGAMSGRLRRWASDPNVDLPVWFGRAHLIAAALLVLIVVLVVRKAIA